MAKAPDLLVHWHTADHQSLLQALESHAYTFGNEIRFVDGDLVGIEVECSDPDKTIPNNLAQDRAAGLQHIIFAVLPKAEERAIKQLEQLTSDHQGLYVINVLTLLDALRGSS